ncbi:threonylcarbamoyl-AMP synthase [Aerococcaceae bacterium DSM 111020]|nr:threonylcarbamoyl-AMP synthase [Aerococcaceae bacterium DSM 111020]
MTEIFTRDQLHQVAERVRAGGIVAFPTETVYGLGAIANNATAVQQVFQVKGRPQDNPLIVHVDGSETVANFVAITPPVQQLMDAFWPGPLTIIFPYQGDDFAPSISAGNPTVSMRMPNNPDTLALIEAVGFPMVGPSANKSGRPSPTRLEHVLTDFDGEIDGVLSSEAPISQIGVESTVIYPLEQEIVILRPGAITKEMLERVVHLPVVEKSASQQQQEQIVYSPGVKYTHYSPKQPVYLIPFDCPLEKVVQWLSDQSGKIGLLADDAYINTLGEYEAVTATYSFGASGDIEAATRLLYAGLRALEQEAIDRILVQGFNAQDERAHALMNRLSKASNFVL